ncbi:hypothetical protein F5878DRAFT_676422 [Lentinula raphanica]|uniref:Uncharacterized protein n=1 Tax=Lentinula raphanica TaxID=153919 RepID=A0AA38PC47_9AGAR|nr:hypothetical protein F5878DRAFT_676422 [Lentinula raphanica]
MPPSYCVWWSSSQLQSISSLYSSNPALEQAEECLEEKVYNKVTSGLHASISTQCLGYLIRATGEWGSDLQCYIIRVASRSERPEYFCFDAVLLLPAVSRMTPCLTQYVYVQGLSQEEIGEAERNLGKVVDCCLSLREDFKASFRNVFRIMDCIECDQCRLWGKVQTADLATAMKILFDLDDNVFNFALNSSSETDIQRSELAALSNPPNRFSESIQAATRFMSLAQPPAHADPEERIDPDNVRGGFGDDFSATDGQSVYATRLRDKGVRLLEALEQWWLEASD